MSVLVVQHLITLKQACTIGRFFRQKRHATMGYFFDLQDLGCKMGDAEALTGLEPYRVPRGPAGRSQDAYLLRVYRDVPGR